MRPSCRGLKSRTEDVWQPRAEPQEGRFHSVFGRTTAYLSLAEF
jgi:hypothetical protein